MSFPEIKMEEWELLDRDILWIEFGSSGVEMNAGEGSLYIRKISKNSKFKQLLITSNVYGYGIVAETWALFEERDGKLHPKCFISRMLKDGKWTSGILNNKIAFSRIKDPVAGKTRGLKLRLQTGPKIFTELEIIKDAGGKT